MQVIILGGLGWFDNEYDFTASVLIKDLDLVFDAGSGLFRISEYYSDAIEELRIFLSHMHTDHLRGLIGLPRYVKIKKLYVYCPLGKKPFVEQFYGPPYFVRSIYSYDWDADIVELSEGVYTFKHPLKGEFKVRTKYFHHVNDYVLGYSLEYEGKKVVYITDTMITEDSVDFIRDADLLIHECMYPDEYAPIAARQGHTTPTILGKYAKKANVKKVVLFHIYPGYMHLKEKYLSQIRKVFPHAYMGIGRSVFYV